MLAAAAAVAAAVSAGSPAAASPADGVLGTYCGGGGAAGAGEGGGDRPLYAGNVTLRGTCASGEWVWCEGTLDFGYQASAPPPWAPGAFGVSVGCAGLPYTYAAPAGGAGGALRVTDAGGCLAGAAGAAGGAFAFAAPAPGVVVVRNPNWGDVVARRGAACTLLPATQARVARAAAPAPQLLGTYCAAAGAGAGAGAGVAANLTLRGACVGGAWAECEGSLDFAFAASVEGYAASAACAGVPYTFAARADGSGAALVASESPDGCLRRAAAATGGAFTFAVPAPGVVTLRNANWGAAPLAVRRGAGGGAVCPVRAVAPAVLAAPLPAGGTYCGVGGGAGSGDTPFYVANATVRAGVLDFSYDIPSAHVAVSCAGLPYAVPQQSGAGGIFFVADPTGCLAAAAARDGGSEFMFRAAAAGVLTIANSKWGPVTVTQADLGGALCPRK